MTCVDSTNLNDADIPKLLELINVLLPKNNLLPKTKAIVCKMLSVPLDSNTVCTSYSNCFMGNVDQESFITVPDAHNYYKR
jgi:hypothetical protein